MSLPQQETQKYILIYLFIVNYNVFILSDTGILASKSNFPEARRIKTSVSEQNQHSDKLFRTNKRDCRVDDVLKQPNSGDTIMRP